MLAFSLFLIGSLLEAIGAWMLQARSANTRFAGEQALFFGIGWSMWSVVVWLAGWNTVPIGAGILGTSIVACFVPFAWTGVIWGWPRLSLSLRCGGDQ